MRKIVFQLDALDGCKLMLACMVVGIHAGFVGSPWVNAIVWPLLRCAVPLFFTISSFLFFSRLKNADDARGQVLRYCRRVATLYLFWSAVWFPFALMQAKAGGCFSQGYGVGALKFLWRLVLGGGFVGGWFIVASALAILLIFILSKACRNELMVCVGLGAQVVCCLKSSYADTLSPGMLTVIGGIESVFGEVYLSVFAAIFWTVVGKICAEKDLRMSGRTGSLLGLFFYGGLVSEWWMRYQATGVIRFDCYFCLMPFCVLVFIMLKNARFKLVHARIMRSLSVVLFCTYGAIVFHLHLIPGFPEDGTGCLKWGMTIGLCSVICSGLYCLRKIPMLEKLKHIM